MTIHLCPEILPAPTAKLMAQLQKTKPKFLHHFYLSGGTALGLQLCHRESEDLDFFSQDPFDPQRVEQELRQFGELQHAELAEGTLNTFVDGVKVQFLEYPYVLLEKCEDWLGIELSTVLDIACTKLRTIGMRGTRKDFIDLFFILEHYSLQQLFASLQRKYDSVHYSQTHILKSSVYFEDAVKQPMPRMHKEVGWEQVKSRMIEAIKTISF